MKTLLFIILATVISCTSLCQSSGGIFTIDTKVFANNDARFTYGFTMSGAGILKEKGQKKSKGVMLGAGVGLHMFESGGTPYIPVFLEVGYIHKEKLLFPYINVRGGYGFNDSKTIKGGFYSEFRGGLSVRVGVCRFSPYIGLSMSQFRVRVMGETIESTHQGSFIGGLAFVFSR